MVADVAWHNPMASDGQEQPHAHVMLTIRHLDADGFGAKSGHEWIEDPNGRTHPDGRPAMVVSKDRSRNCPDYFERYREDWERIANAAPAKVGSEERIDRHSLLARGLSRLPEPALRLAWYMHAWATTRRPKHYQAVERATKTAFTKRDASPDIPPSERIHNTQRFFDWFDRQLARLEPAPRMLDINQNPGRDR
jgi:MobA/MobL family